MFGVNVHLTFFHFFNFVVVVVVVEAGFGRG